MAHPRFHSRPAPSPASPASPANGAATAPRPADSGTEIEQRPAERAGNLAGRHRRRRLGRRAHRRHGFLTGMLLRKVPKGTNWFYTLGSATLFAFIDRRRSPGSSWRCTTRRRRPRPTTRSPTSPTTSSSASSCAACTSGARRVMIILIFLHMARTFFFGAYKYPRELNWVIGVVLLILTMVMGLTGYLLPFDQRSFWATIVAMNITGTGPVVGPYLADFLRAGAEFGATTLSRFYAIHMLLMPGLIIALIGAHLYLVVKLGTTAPPWVRAREAEAGDAGGAAAGGKQRQRQRSGGGRMKPREGGLPPRVRGPEEEGQAVLPVRDVQGLGDDADRRPRRDRRDVAHPRRRAGPEGRPDHDHLRAAARVVLLLPLRAAAGDQAARAGADRDGRHPDRCAWSCCCCCRSTTATRSGGPERRPIATTAGILTIVAMAYLTYLGASAGSPDRDRPEGRRNVRGRHRWSAQSGCLACHKLGENGNNGPGPELTQIAETLPAGDRDRPLGADPGPGSCPPTGTCRRRSSTSWSTSSPRWTERRRPGSLARLDEPGSEPRGQSVRDSPPSSRGRSTDVRPDRRRLRPDEHGDDGRAAPPLARARPPTAPSSAPATRALDVCCGTGDLAFELAGGSAPTGT